MFDPNNPTYTDRQPVGLAYSPTGNLLYVICQYNIWQYDFNDLSWYHVAGLDTSWQKFQAYNTAYLGPDDKLYIGNFGGQSRQMSVINNPDVKGTGCDFCPRCLRLDTLTGVAGAGTPPCMPNYSLGAQTCWPESSTEFAVDSMQLTLYPNPAYTIVYIKTAGKIASLQGGQAQTLAKTDQAKELYNSIGQLLFSTTQNEIDVRKFSTGVYYIKVGNQVRKLIIE